MPYPLNNATTADAYADAATVLFPRPTNAFSVQIYNAGVYYRVLLVPKDSLQSNAYQTDVYEHFLGPLLAAFDESDLPAGSTFAGIQFRSALAGTPAQVTVNA